MIKTLLAGMLLILSSGSNDVKGLTAPVDSASSYLITGKIRNYNNEWIYLGHSDNIKRGMRIDSAKVINGEFSFSGEISGIAPFILGIHDKDNKGKIRPSVMYQGPFILSPGHLYTGGEFDGQSPLTAYGTKAQDEYNAFSKKVGPLQKKLTNILGERNGTKTKRPDSLNTRYRLVGNQIKDAVKAHVIQFPNSLVSAYIAKLNLENADATTIKSVYDPLTSTVKESVYGIALLQMLQSNELTSIDRILPSFNIPDLKGQLVSLEDSRGSYTLIDFWASWCGPCRMEHPNLIKAYNSYQAKGFKIISISMDTNKALWLKAVNEDKLSWLQLSDLKGMQSETRKKYGITLLPMNFLIDKEGKIIARDLRGMELINKLEEVL
ncbi:TlpA disulfide reductase family protein [Pedobacter sp. PLR]|uniref:TlpA disulfide reductase family protein n=1 Tax=Pedobacter sp. PLR TaxID=2994465 RepID=UPI002247D055|nr:TlpA disulfide reductase family protein [Pedobacter sp. PLR]MCX2449657.1 TlpA disulfide reductase family protein [Pedobacter sp. PLR]